MTLTHDDVKNLISIVDSAEHLEEFELGWGDFRIHLWRTNSASRTPTGTAPLHPSPKSASISPTIATAPSQPATASNFLDPKRELELAPGEMVIRAPMLGTFYRAASPGETPFVDVGQSVHSEDTVCLIEVMKLFNSISAGVDGIVTRILHENGALIEFDEPIMVIRAGGE